MTNHWVDIKNADVVLVMGGNAAEAHPCGFKWVIEAQAHNNAKLIVVDPRFTRTAAVADLYVPIRSGTDIIFLGGVIKYLLDNDLINKEYVKNYTDFTFIVREDFALTGSSSGPSTPRTSRTSPSPTVSTPAGTPTRARTIRRAGTTRKDLTVSSRLIRR